jgi:hypothetical protein
MINKWWEKKEPIGEIEVKLLLTKGTQIRKFVSTALIGEKKIYITNETYKEKSDHAEPLVILEDFVISVRYF